ncbi:MAG: matrixin family metalloprotease [Planctomycetales bacterium]|nr:matrixin family metalloprotease [Planctomycetales bacterium]
MLVHSTRTPLFTQVFIAIFAIWLVFFAGRVLGQTTEYTYSYSNLFDGGITLGREMTEFDMVRAVEEGMALWASVAPVSFNERIDSGPAVSDSFYSRRNHPDIRIGHHALGDTVLAHAYFPGNGGLDSDIHMDDSDRTWSQRTFFTTFTHELGHAIGLDHFDLTTAVMNSVLDDNFMAGIDAGQLFQPDINAVQRKYGTGTGTVTSYRAWLGNADANWETHENWDRSFRPTRFAEVTLANATVQANAQDNAAKLINLRNSATLQLNADSQLAVSSHVTTGSGDNVISVETNATLKMESDLTLATVVGSQGQLLIRDGLVTINGNIVSGAGRSTLEMHGGVLKVANARNQQMLITVDQSVEFFAPTDDSLGSDWVATDYTASGWRNGFASLGYERGTGLKSLIRTDVDRAMFGVTPTLYARMEFDVDQVDAINSLILQVRTDDGFVAYLNGVAVTKFNAPDDVTWDSEADVSLALDDVLQKREFDLSPFSDLLQETGNVLAIHGMNSGKFNSDFLLMPELIARSVGGTVQVEQFDFYGGQLLDVTTIQSQFQHVAGELSPSQPGSNGQHPGTLQMVGSYEMSDESVLRLDLADNATDRIMVDGTAEIAGTLSLFNSDSNPFPGPTARDSESSITLLSADAITGQFQSILMDDRSFEPGHQEAGLFRRIVTTATEVLMVDYLADIGDSNGDGLFDSTDLVFTFQSSEYEDDIIGNSDWTEGDWNLDQEFDSSDFVLAFQSGRYEATLQPVVAVPEPQTVLMLGSVGALGLLQRRRRVAVL